MSEKMLLIVRGEKICLGGDRRGDDGSVLGLDIVLDSTDELRLGIGYLVRQQGVAKLLKCR